MESILNGIKSFLESKWSIVTVCILTSIFYFFEVKYLQYYFYTLIFVLLIMTKAKWYVAPITCISVLASSRFNGDFTFFNLSSPLFIFVIIFGVILLGFLIYDIVINFSLYKEKVKHNWLLYSLFFILISMIISLIFSPVKHLSVLCVLGQLLTIFIVLVLSIKIDFDEIGRKMMMFSFICAMWLIGAECLYVFFDLLFIQKIPLFDIMQEKLINLGWAISNRYVVICNMGLIACFFWYWKLPDVKNRIFSLISVVLGIFINLLSCCRSAYLGLFIILPMIIGYFVYYFYKSINRKRELTYLAVIILGLIGIICIGLSLDSIHSIIDAIIEFGFKLRGRDDVWEVAINSFLRHPIIGCGPLSGSYYIKLEVGRDFINNYHNYVLDALATTGIIGLAAFVFFIYVMIHKCLKGKDIYFKVMLLLVVYFLINGLFDSLFLNYQLMPIMLIPFSIIPDNGIGKIKQSEDELE